MPIPESNDPNNEPVSITLSARHWVIVLGMIEHCVQRLRAQARSPASLSGSDTVALGGSLVARAKLIDELVRVGILKPGASEKHGFHALRQMIDRALGDRRAKGS